MIYSQLVPLQRSSRQFKSHGKGRTSKIRSLCPSEGLQGVSKAMARAEQAKIKAYALPEAFKVSQKPQQGQNKQKSKPLPFQRPSRQLKSHGKGRTSFNRRPVLRLILSSGASALSEAFKAVQKPRQGQNKLNSQLLPFQRPSRQFKNHGKGRTS